MADISFSLGGYRINFRVGGLFIRDDKVLLNRLATDTYWFLPGGRVAAGESTRAAIQREIREELGGECAILRPVFLLENFFTLAVERFHEIGLYYLLDPAAINLPRDGEHRAMDGGIVFRWQPLHDLAAIDFRPAVLAARLAHLPDGLEHLIQRDG